MRLQNWNKYEAALLLQTCLDIQSGKTDKTFAIIQLSDSLRQMAINKGVNIDSVYRNFNGIQWQLSYMEKALASAETKSRTPSRLFSDIAVLYKTDRVEFEKILANARAMCEKNDESVQEAEHSITKKEAFEEWYSSQKRKFPLTFVLSSFENAFSLLNTNKDSRRIWNYTNITAYNICHNEITSNRLFRVMHSVERENFEKTWKIYADFLREYEEQYPGKYSLLPIRSADNSSISKQEAPTKAEETPVVEAPVAELPAVETSTTNNDSPAQENSRILYSDVLLDYFDKLKAAYPNLEFTNVDAKGVAQRRCVYIFRKDLPRHNNVLLEIWMTSVDSIFAIFAKRVLLTEEENREVDQTHKRATQSRGKLDRKFLFADDLLSFVGDKLQKANGVVTSDLLKRPKNPSKGPKPQESEISEIMRGQLTALLKSRYAFGFRYDSPREINRLRGFAEAENIALPETDEALKNVLLACGNIVDGKLYAKDESMQEALAQLVNEIVAEGVSIIYYEPLMEQQSGFMSEHHISSEDLLKELLQESLSGFHFAGKYFNVGTRSTEIELVGKELQRIWGEDAVLSFSKMMEALPYVPELNIQRALSFGKLFVWNADGEYLLLDRFIISEKEKAALAEFVAAECEKNGFASLLEVPMSNLEVENFQVSNTGMQMAVYNAVLAADYSLVGKVLTKRGERSLDAVTIVKASLKGRDEVTLDETLKIVEDVIGEPQRRVALNALYDEFVRVDKNRFVSRQHLRFEISEIDAILEEMLPDGFGAVKSITTFAMFPMCGYMWNAYVLESYCYLFSKEYSLHNINFNDKNAGIIAKKNLYKEYYELLALALEKADITLDEDHALEYLYQNGFLAKHSYGRIKDVLQKATESKGIK